MSEPTIFPNPHAEAAKVLLDKIRALRAEVPYFLVEASPAERKKLAAVTGIRPEVLESASVAVGESEQLASVIGANAAKMRDAYAYTLAYEAVVNELRAFTGSVIHTIRVHRAEAAATALDVLAVARRLGKRKAELRPHVEAMQRHIRGGRKRRVAPPPPASPVTPDRDE